MPALAIGERTKRSKEKEAVGVQKGNVNEKRTLWKEEERCEEDAKTQK